MPLDYDVHPEHQYLQLIRQIMNNGTEENGRNGNVKMIFGNMMRFSLKDGEIPLLTTKKLAYKTCFHELMWFSRGSTDNKELQEKNVHIWDGNSSRQFLNNVGLHHLDEGDIGAGYGFQWCHWGAEYIDCKTDYTGKGINQLHSIIDNLKDPEKRSSRRLILSAWNVSDLDKMALNPCHILCQFNVHDGNKLSCSMYQRSVDVGLGQPFNIASYSFLTHLLAKHCDLVAHEFVYFFGNAHIYEEHIDQMKEQLTREPHQFPTIHIKHKHANISEYKIDDFELCNYKHHAAIKMEMIA